MAGLGTDGGTDAHMIFDSLVSIMVGRGDMVLSWTDRWIHGFTVEDIAPLLATRVDVKTKNNRISSQVLVNERWTSDLHPDTSFFRCFNWCTLGMPLPQFRGMVRHQMCLSGLPRLQASTQQSPPTCMFVKVSFGTARHV